MPSGNPLQGVKRGNTPIKIIFHLAFLAILDILAILEPHQSLSPMSVPTKSINLTDFDFAVTRPRLTNTAPHDGIVTIRMPGKTRKGTNHELVFMPYFKKYKLKFKTVAIGKNKKKTQAPVVIFDEHTLGQESATIRKYDRIGGIVNSKGHALKLLEIFKIAVPAHADEVLKLYFHLHPTLVDRNKLNYRICVISLIKVIKPEHNREKAALKVKKKKILNSGASNPPKADDKKTPTNIL